MRISDLSGKQLGMLSGIHKGSVTQFEWRNSLVASAGKDGLLCLWDINSKICFFQDKTHTGQISKILLHSDGLDSNLIVTSGVNDGIINCLDMRTNEKVYSKRVIIF